MDEGIRQDLVPSLTASDNEFSSSLHLQNEDGRFRIEIQSKREMKRREAQGKSRFYKKLKLLSFPPI